MNVKKVNPFRVWYYLRQGYSMYLVFVIAVANMMVTTYYLAVQNIPTLKNIFPGFTEWIIVVMAIAVPLSISMGYWHVKRSRAQRSQIEVETEINPYFYRLPPGFWKEVFAPLYVELLRTNVKILQNEKLSEEDIKRIKEIERKLDLLIKGHSFPEKK
ncbi:hypothetical protein [Candidatus Nitrosopumilus sediminis]|uniref:Uncharacterized protein n=1 Tax=Candidatus Nitrosopumilus sediminis TaxID=1229909 RepID=K0B8T7_9ARCH|nr:hypothetical protein [Candidatus Nitrosopumilus sediminis]AFS81874.1 hypothetical protein NSED_00310 [Candidatus Nitrosopumilus sediminis]